LNNENENLGKFDSKVDEATLCGYSSYTRVFNKRTLVVKESIYVVFDETDHEVTLLVK